MGLCVNAPGGWCDDWNCVRYGCKAAKPTATSGSTGTTATDVLRMEEALKGMRRVLDEAKISDQWVAIDPQGRMYKGKVEELLPVMLRDHPLFAK